MTVADGITAVLMPIGALFTLFGSIGLVRLPTVLGRLHAAAKPDTVGLLLLVGGAAFQLPDISKAAPLLLVALFQLSTIPVLTQTLGRVTYSRGESNPAHLVVDDLADALRNAKEEDGTGDDGTGGPLEEPRVPHRVSDQ